MANATSSDAGTEPAHVEAVLVALAMLAPTGFVLILVGPRKPAVLVGIALYFVVMVVGAIVAGLLDAL